MHPFNDTLDPPTTVRLIPDDERLAFLPHYLGGFTMKCEMMVYGWMGRLVETYHGGFWHFYALSNGGFYMAPATDAQMHVAWWGNCYDGDMSADAAGIVATLYALCELANQTGDQHVCELYEWLLDFAHHHPEAAAIGAAID